MTESVESEKGPMKYLGTAFSLTLGGLRLRISIDLDDEPQERSTAPAPHHVEIVPRTKEPAR